MRAKFNLLLARFSGWFPDLSGVPLRRQVTVAAVVSVLFHLLIFLIVAGVGRFMPVRMAAQESPKPKPLELEVQVIPAPRPTAPPPPVKPPAPEKLLTIAADGLQKSAAAPKEAAFESSQHMVAASESAPTGAVPLPSQSGANLPFTQFQNQRAVLGKPIDEESEPPAFKPQPIPKERQDPVAANKKRPPTPAPKAADILLAGPPKAPVKPAPATPKPTATPPVEMAKLTPPTKPSAGAVAEQRKTRVEGSISNRGKAAVDAVKTPLGVYRQKVSAQISARWHYYTKQRVDLLALGTVRVKFFVTQNGRIQDVQVVENESNQSFADVCEQSVRDAEIPPPPGELELLKDGRLELAFSFTLY